MSSQENESFINHIETLRQTLIKCICSLCVVFPFMFFAAPKVLNGFIDFIRCGKNISLNFFTPVEVFLIQIKTAFVLALVICFPYITKQLWDFILPALYEHERKIIKSIVFLSTILFILGVCFCLFLIMPLVIQFGMSFAGRYIRPVLGISNIINLALYMSVICGLIFQIPLAVFFLIKSRLTEYETIADKRPYIITGLLISAGILTPPDVISQLILASPAYILFEAGLLCAKYLPENE